MYVVQTPDIDPASSSKPRQVQNIPIPIPPSIISCLCACYLGYGRTEQISRTEKSRTSLELPSPHHEPENHSLKKHFKSQVIANVRDQPRNGYYEHRLQRRRNQRDAARLMKADKRDTYNKESRVTKIHG